MERNSVGTSMKISQNRYAVCLKKSKRLDFLSHTHATLLLLEGMHPKVVQERLGHCTVMMTLDTYSHILPDMQDTAVKVLEGLFREKVASYSITEQSSTIVQVINCDAA